MSTNRRALLARQDSLDSIVFDEDTYIGELNQKQFDGMVFGRRESVEDDNDFKMEIHRLTGWNTEVLLNLWGYTGLVFLSVPNGSDTIAVSLRTYRIYRFDCAMKPLADISEQGRLDFIEVFQDEQYYCDPSECYCRER
jgi:hypothetical protein